MILKGKLMPYYVELVSSARARAIVPSVTASALSAR